MSIAEQIATLGRALTRIDRIESSPRRLGARDSLGAAQTALIASYSLQEIRDRAAAELLRAQEQRR